ncbi:hypothetical protein H0H87_011505 [Tephrocybe sp. NHM501043]|nr:hypothetical protein H0H87_011505 [Tephrocybe sp. NHM501043]
MSCPDCTAGEFLPGEPLGTTSILGAYFSPGSSSASGPGEAPTKSAIVLLTDVFGLPLKNCKIIADHLAKETGYDVWIPDYFGGRPILPLSSLKSVGQTGGKTSFFDWIRFYIFMIHHLPALYHSRTSVSDQRVVDLVTALKQEKKYEKIGSVGYCFGGAALARLGGKDVFQSIIICHPGPFTLDQAKAIKVPVAWVCAEEDQFFDGDKRSQVEAIFAERKGTENFVDYEFKDYKGTVHGFAIRPNLTNPEVKVAYEGSLDQIKSWFLKTLAL